jgi:hypothetical protein
MITLPQIQCNVPLQDFMVFLDGIIRDIPINAVFNISFRVGLEKRKSEAQLICDQPHEMRWLPNPVARTVNLIRPLRYGASKAEITTKRH